LYNLIRLRANQSLADFSDYLFLAAASFIEIDLGIPEKPANIRPVLELNLTGCLVLSR
jgi:hypothetical protein